MSAPRAPLTAASVWRRIGVCLLALAVVDQAVLPILRAAEARRYESDVPVRFENSDLFVIGPLTAYFKEHPVGRKPRVVFFGNSFVWGYGVDGHETLPAMFQRLEPSARVFNFGINGFESGNAYLMSKAIIDAVDTVYLVHIGEHANPILAQLIPVSQEDIARFHLRSASTPRLVPSEVEGLARDVAPPASRGRPERGAAESRDDEVEPRACPGDSTNWPTNWQTGEHTDEIWRRHLSRLQLRSGLRGRPEGCARPAGRAAVASGDGASRLRCDCAARGL